ncbi:hypothetical protein DKT68_19195 [Micromonospora acroterricola]|uniref:Glycine zipper family protein n=1 Tax=Micromonospora acroterricola TaxID=2202421 RepID=A0A317D0S7_9ACTN|nr:hypothetical protein [Micromonospora acroterricola]PWR07416.1 hypothetical protein DKT68_19195 [Micromonospora acroterricola]
MADPKTETGKSNAWAWPVGILLGLAIGIPSFGSTGGVAFGVAIGIAFAIAFGAIKKPAEKNAVSDPDGGAGTTDSGPTRTEPEDAATGDAAGGSRQG